MGFKNGAYATVWGIEDKGKTTSVRLSISKKNSKTNEYETDFSGFCRFIGEAHKNAYTLKVKDRIRLNECEVTTLFVKDTGREYVTYKVFSFEKTEPNNKNSQSNVQQKPSYSQVREENDIDANEVPF